MGQVVPPDIELVGKSGPLLPDVTRGEGLESGADLALDVDGLSISFDT